MIDVLLVTWHYQFKTNCNSFIHSYPFINNHDERTHHVHSGVGVRLKVGR